MAYEWRISQAQVFANKRGQAFQALDDSEALCFKRGDWLISRPAHRYACDALHILKSGEVVRLQGTGKGVTLTRCDGSSELVTISETREMVIGYVIEVARA